MRREIRELQQRLGITTIFVTHDQEEANTVADRMAVLNEGILQQVGTPMSLYDYPVNRFVAKFLGTANLLDGDIRKQDGLPVFHAANQLTIPLQHEVAEASRATVLFRPQNLAIVEPGSEPVADKTYLKGQIQHREFLGNLIRYGISINGKDILVDDGHQVGGRSFQVNEEVEVALDPTQVRILTS